MSRFAGRSLDRIWFYFFLLHIPVSLAVDFQALYPAEWTAKTPLPAFVKWYTSWSRDPILLGGMGQDAEWAWLRTFFWLEAVFQLPVWVIGAWGLWNTVQSDDKRVYPLLLAYGASTATTLIPTLNALLYTKIVPPLSTAELGNLLGCYIPYFVIPLGIAVDMGVRLNGIIGQAQLRKQA